MDDQEDDIEAARTPSLLKIAGGMGVLAGAIMILTGVQTLTGFRVSGIYFIGPIVLVLFGGALSIAGTLLVRARATGAILQLTLGIVALLSSGAWLLLSLAGGLASLFGLVSPLLACVALGMAIASIKQCDEVNTARRRLAEKGLNLGV